MSLEWQEILLRDICERINYGYTASATHEEVGPKFLRITDIVPTLINWQTVPFCRINDTDIYKYVLNTGDIVIARTGATTGYAKHIRNHPKSVFASYLVRIRLKESVDNRFIGLVLESEEYKRFIKTNLTGSAQPQANAQILTSYPLVLPPLPVQRKIAGILSAYDDLIENNRRRIALLEEMAQALYREWFVHFRYPGYEQDALVESALGAIPEGWGVVRLGDICFVTMGQSPSSEFYNANGDGLPFHQGVTNFGSRYPTDRMYCTVEGRIAQAGDILFSVRAPVGRINIADKKIVIGRGLSAIRSRNGTQAFLFYQLKEQFQEEDSIGNGAIFKSVTREDVHGVKLIYPEQGIVARFDASIEPIFSILENLTKRNINLRRTRDLLLPRLIGGELDVAGLDVALGEGDVGG